MTQRKRSIIKGDIPSHYSRPEAQRTIAAELGIPEPRQDADMNDPLVRKWHDIYHKLGPAIYNNPNIPTPVIGSGGTTGRIKQVHKKHLYEHAKKEYGIEIDEWRPEDVVVLDERITDIEQVLVQHKKGYLNDTQVIKIIGRILHMETGHSGEGAENENELQ